MKRERRRAMLRGASTVLDLRGGRRRRFKMNGLVDHFASVSDKFLPYLQAEGPRTFVADPVPGGLEPPRFAALLDIGDQWRRGRELTESVPKMSPEQLSRAAEAASLIGDGYVRARLRVAILEEVTRRATPSTTIPALNRSRLGRQVVEDTLRLGDPSLRLSLVAVFAPLLSSDQFVGAVRVAASLTGEKRVQGLAVLHSRLPPAFRDAAIKEIVARLSELTRLPERIGIMAFIADRMPLDSPLRASLMNQVLGDVVLVKDPFERMRVLVEAVSTAPTLLAGAETTRTDRIFVTTLADTRQRGKSAERAELFGEVLDLVPAGWFSTIQDELTRAGRAAQAMARRARDKSRAAQETSWHSEERRQHGA
jgi:hypothetical protein